MENLPVRYKSDHNFAASPNEWTTLIDQRKSAYETQATGIFEWLCAFRRYKRHLILASLGGLLLGILVTIPQTPTYQARTSLEVQDIDKDFLNLNQVNPVAEANPITALSDLQTQIKILQSEVLSDRTVEKLKTASPTCPAAADAHVGFLQKAMHFIKPVPNTPRRQMLGAAAKSVRIRAAGQTRIIEITVDSADPKVACGFANVLASQFIEQSIEARWSMTQRTGDWLARELEGMRLKLEHSEDALQAYARKTGLLYTAEKQSVSEQKLYQLQSELSKAEADRVAKQSRFEMTRTATPDSLPDVMNDNNLRELQSKLTDLRRQKAELAATFKPDYSKSKRVDAQIVAIESALDREHRTMVDRIANEFQEARHHEMLLTSAYAAQTRLVTQDSEKAIQYNILKREVDSNRQLYEAMLQRVKESSIASALKPSNVRIIDVAKLPSIPYTPSLPLNAALGFMGGGIAGLAGILILSQVRVSLQQPGDAALLLGVPELGVIPSAEQRKKLPRKSNGGWTDVLRTKLGSPDRSFAAWNVESTMVADSFRGVIASILFSSEKHDRPRVLVITSAGPGEGKTSAASNLAHAMAQINAKVLLVDADLRKPRIHKIFDLDNQAGLADLLKPSIFDENAAAALVQKTGIQNLDVLTSGSAHAVADLFFSSAMPNFITWCRNCYEMVIIDTPPKLSVPDARMLGPIADAFVLVVRAGQTSRNDALAAHQRLTEDRTRVLGVVLNDWDARRSGGGYYSYASAAEIDSTSTPA
jgi:capsular exopolysaccharide synthesis family protein